MQQLYIVLIVSFLGWVLLKALRSPERLYEYPYFMAATFVIFIGPQIVSLIRFPGSATPTSIESLLLMTLLCAIASVYSNRPIPGLVFSSSYSLRDARLKQIGVFYLCMSWFFLTLFSRTFASSHSEGLLSGTATIYLFFSNVIYIAIAILLRNALRTHSISSWILFAFTMVPPIQAAVFGGRRESTAHALIAIGLTLYFEKRWVPPRVIAIFSLAFAMVAIPATGTYRAIASDGDWENLSKLNLVANFENYLSRESILELRNAALVIEATEQTGNFAFGVGYWDEIVWRFVPAQLVGRDFKNFLMIERDTGSLASQLLAVGYTIPPGSTLSGIGDSFVQFGYLGALFFFALGRFFRSLWDKCKQGNLVAKLLYIGVFTSAMRSVTHQTVDFLPALIYQIMFITIAFFYAYVPQKHLTAMQKTAHQNLDRHH